MARPRKQNLREQAHEQIRNRILSGEFGPGSVLSEYQLAAELGFSRTPIREAIRDLAKVGLVDVLPKRGIVVRGISATDILEIFQIREALEVLTVRIAVDGFSEEQIKAMRADHDRSIAAAERGRKREAYELAVKLHQHIRSVCNNRRLETFMQTLDDQVYQLGLVTLAVSGRLADALSEHERIVRAIEARDAAEAERLMVEHLRTDRDAAMNRTTPASLIRATI